MLPNRLRLAAVIIFHSLGPFCLLALQGANSKNLGLVKRNLQPLPRGRPLTSEAASWLKQQLAILRGESHVTLGLAFGKLKSKIQTKGTLTKNPSSSLATTADILKHPLNKLFSSPLPYSNSYTALYSNTEPLFPTTEEALSSYILTTPASSTLFTPIGMQSSKSTLHDVVYASSATSSSILTTKKTLKMAALHNSPALAGSKVKKPERQKSSTTEIKTHEIKNEKFWDFKDGSVASFPAISQNTPLGSKEQYEGITENHLGILHSSLKNEVPGSSFYVWENNSLYFDPSYLSHVFGGLPLYFFYPEYGLGYNQSTTSTYQSNMEQMYPHHGATLTQHQNQSQSVVNQVSTNQNFIIQLPNGTNITSFNVQTNGGEIIINTTDFQEMASGKPSSSTVDSSSMPPSSVEPTNGNVFSSTFDVTIEEIDEATISSTSEVSIGLPMSSLSNVIPSVSGPTLPTILSTFSSSSVFTTKSPSSGAASENQTNQNNPTVYTCNGAGSDYTANFISPSYPYASNSPGLCIFNLFTKPGICQIRVDILESSWAPPEEGVCSKQYFTVQGDIWPVGVKKICGMNKNNHFYVEIRDVPSPMVEFSVATLESGDYRWGIWITQVDCFKASNIKAPEGCFQYFTGSTGWVESFSFADGQYYIDQHYRICISAHPDTCSITFTANEGDFMLEKFGSIKEVPFNRSGMSSLYCVRDYLRIPEGSSDGADYSPSHDRYCGGHLAPSHGSSAPSSISSRVSSRIVSIDFHSGIPKKFVPKAHGPGFKIMFHQISCASKHVRDSVGVGRGSIHPLVPLPLPSFLKSKL